MPPAERIPSSVRPKGKRPRVRVWYSSSTKARISTRLVSMVFWSYSLILPSPVLTLEPPAASQEMGVGAEATDHPLPTAVSKTMSREGKDKCGPLLSCTLWSPVCWKTQTDSNTLCWDRTLELQMLSCIWNTFSTKVWRVLKCTISGYYFFFLIYRSSAGFGLTLSWGNSSPATYLLKDLWQFIANTYSWVSLSINEPHLAAERIIQGNKMKTQGQRSTQSPPPCARKPNKQTNRKLRV